MKQYKCPYCEFKGDSEKLIDHINDEHSEMIPEKYTATRLVYNIRNKKDHGSCLMCKKPTEWNEDKARYYSLCNDKKCHDAYVKRFEKNMIKVYEKPRLLDDIEHQEKMLANRKISGEYTFSDGGKHTYTGSFEHKALEFLDKVLHVKSKELMVPGPVLEYKNTDGKLRKYIPDIYWIDLNLLIEVKDGGNNPNKRNMPEYRDKQAAKEKMITDKGEFNYLRLTNNNFEQLFNIIAEIKQANLEGKPNKVIRINEAYNLEVGPVGGMPSLHATSGYLIYHGFNGIDPTSDDDNATDSISSNYKCAITNDLASDKALEQNKDGMLRPILLKDIFKESSIKVYRYFGSKKKLIETCQKAKLENSLYEELSGHKQYTKDQIDYDPLFERFSYTKEQNKTKEYMATLESEYKSLVGIPNTALPIINDKIAGIAKEKLVPYPSLLIKEDMNGFFAYNKYTGKRTQSYKDINDLKLEDTNLEDKEAEKWAKETNKTIIGDEYDPEELEIKKQKFYDMPKKARRESDWESFRIYHMTNQELYDRKHSEQLKKDLSRQLVDNYDGIEPIAEETYNFNLVKYGNAEVEKAKEWAATSMRFIIVPRNNIDDLDYDWAQFKSQVRKLQRESDWKSQELFGMNNETHYNYLRNKLVRVDIKDDNPEVYDGVAKTKETEYNRQDTNTKYANFHINHVMMQPKPEETPVKDVTPKVESAAEIMLCERTNKIAKLMKVHNLPILFSDDDIIYNGNAFRDKKVNVILITGMSGGGKTTLASKICKFTGAQLIELDMFSHWAEYKENPKAFANSLFDSTYPKVLDDYFKKAYRNVDEYRQKLGLIDHSSKRYYAEMLKMIEYFIKVSNPSNRFVIEGVQIPVVTLLNTSILDKTTTILVNTSVVRSFFYRMIRDELKLSEIKSLLTKYYNWYLSQNNHRELLNGYYLNHLDHTDDTMSTMNHIFISGNGTKTNSASDFEESSITFPMHTNGLMQTTFEKLDDNLSDLPCFTPDEMDYYGINGGEIGDAFIEAWKQVFWYGNVQNPFVESAKDFTQSNTVFHISRSKDEDGTIYKPRLYIKVPDKYKDRIDDKGVARCEDIYGMYEEVKTPRVCFSESILGCINSIIDLLDSKTSYLTKSSNEVTVNKEIKYYIYIPENSFASYKNKTNAEIVKEDLVSDAKQTKECWILEPVKVKQFGYLIIPEQHAKISNKISNFKYEIYDKSGKKIFSNFKESSFIKENKKRIQKLSAAITDEEKLKLGWNPAIPFTPDNRAKIDLKMNKKINHVIVNEAKEFPVKIGKDYSIYIKRSKKVEFEKLYQDCHELLVQYEKAENIEGIKYELVKMAWIRASVELNLDDLRATGKGISSDSKKLINLRARCINDFKKYLAIVLKHDSSYNFTKHYEASPFNDGVYKIDGSIVKLGKSVKDFWWASK